MLTTACHQVVGLELGLQLGLGLELDLESGCSHVFVLVLNVIVTLPLVTKTKLCERLAQSLRTG